MAVLPSALSETVLPCPAAPVFPVPTNFAPCCVLGAGAVLSVKVVADVTDPPAVVNDIVPDAAPGITIPTRLVPVLEMTMAAVPPMVKAVGVSRLVPVMVTNVPTEPLDGLKEVIAGACAKRFRTRNCKANTLIRAGKRILFFKVYVLKFRLVFKRKVIFKKGQKYFLSQQIGFQA